MHVCTMVFSHTASTASGSPFSPWQTTISTSRVPRFLISEQTRIQNFAQPSPVAVLPLPAAIDPHNRMRPETVRVQGWTDHDQPSQDHARRVQGR